LARHGAARLMPVEAAMHPHVAAEQAARFSCHDGGSTECEYLELLAALVGVTKPARVLETGCFHGYGTYTLARACQVNGQGVVISLDSDPRFVQETRGRLLAGALLNRARVWEATSTEWLTTQDVVPFQFAFFDSGELDVRLEELELCLSLGWLERGATFAIHDTSRLRSCDDTGTPAPGTAPFWDRLTWLADVKDLHLLEFPLSRGMVVGRVG
jgi:predicted O-methyltransferase YrrM